MGDPEFGANLDDYVYALRYNETMLKGVIEKQIAYYIPLAAKYNSNNILHRTRSATATRGQPARIDIPSMRHRQES